MHCFPLLSPFPRHTFSSFCCFPAADASSSPCAYFSTLSLSLSLLPFLFLHCLNASSRVLFPTNGGVAVINASLATPPSLPIHSIPQPYLRFSSLPPHGQERARERRNAYYTPFSTVGLASIYNQFPPFNSVPLKPQSTPLLVAGQLLPFLRYSHLPPTPSLLSTSFIDFVTVGRQARQTFRTPDQPPPFLRNLPTASPVTPLSRSEELNPFCKTSHATYKDAKLGRTPIIQ
ncbi:hypothetical protein K443DRAFT_592450 [Laccaria amethystina LaAM-08-1]|uniref:Uncharacterized protein n=1 Tax=Laccaria amethystina LaAM-08-1 TaxID=1095629 RepID=A0A0C9X774_9AGAR|nr:hypothetical protein K443DRAFT_592450 [Laccaria amethystina LaAM-08-1]